MLKLEEIIDQASQSIGAKRVFGEPYEKNGVTVIPAARVMGGAGGSGGTQPAAGAEGEMGGKQVATPFGQGVGYGISGRPVGAFVIKGDSVTWLPAVDVNRLMFGFQVVMVVFFLVMRSIQKSRAKAIVEAAKAR